MYEKYRTPTMKRCNGMKSIVISKFGNQNFEEVGVSCSFGCAVLIWSI